MKKLNNSNTHFYRKLGWVALGAVGSFFLIRQLKRAGWSNVIGQSSALLISAFASKKTSDDGLTDSEADWQGRASKEESDPAWHH